MRTFWLIYGIIGCLVCVNMLYRIIVWWHQDSDEEIWLPAACGAIMCGMVWPAVIFIRVVKRLMRRRRAHQQMAA